MDTIKPERNVEEHYTRITLSDGTHEDFKTVRGAIVFPFQKAPGVILVGGVCKESETIKILVEREFPTLGIAASELLDLESRFLFSDFYYQDIPETEGPIEYLLRKGNLTALLWPAPHSKDFEYGVLIIGEYLGANRLSVPKNGILANQFMANWENVNTENKPHAVIALSCLLGRPQSFH